MECQANDNIQEFSVDTTDIINCTRRCNLSKHCYDDTHIYVECLEWLN